MFIPILDNCHSKKTSPDGSVVEFKLTKKIVTAVCKELESLNIPARILVPEKIDLPLGERVRRANKIYADNSRKAFLVSIQINTSGADGKWKDSCGWSVFVGTKASVQSIKLAETLYNAATALGLPIRKSLDMKKYWKQDLYITKNTTCPCAVTQNLFLDNKHDVEFLSSEVGFKKIVNLHVKAIKAFIAELEK